MWREPFWRRATRPAVDLVEREKDYLVTAELPGMSEKDVELKLVNDMLTIKGEKKEQKEVKRKDYHISERRYGSFERSFRVPDGVDGDRIEASFNKGVLTVTLSKRPEAIKAARTIDIKPGLTFRPYSPLDAFRTPECIPVDKVGRIAASPSCVGRLMVRRRSAGPVGLRRFGVHA